MNLSQLNELCINKEALCLLVSQAAITSQPPTAWLNLPHPLLASSLEPSTAGSDIAVLIEECGRDIV